MEWHRHSVGLKCQLYIQYHNMILNVLYVQNQKLVSVWKLSESDQRVTGYIVTARYKTLKKLIRDETNLRVKSVEKNGEKKFLFFHRFFRVHNILHIYIYMYIVCVLPAVNVKLRESSKGQNFLLFLKSIILCILPI